MSTQEEYPDNGWTRLDGDLWVQWFGRRLAIGRFALGESSVVWLTPAEAAALAEFLAAPTQGGAE